MTYGIIAAVLAALGWVYSLWLKYQSLRQKNALQAVENTLQNLDDKVSSQDAKVQEDVRDYEKLKAEFNSKYNVGTNDTDSAS